MSKGSEILGRGEAPAKKPAVSPRPAGKHAAAPAPVKVRPAAAASVKRAENAPSRRKGSRKLAALRTILSHAAIILSLMYLVLFVIDRINNAMEFINNDITKVLLVILAVIAIVNAEIALFSERKKR